MKHKKILYILLIILGIVLTYSAMSRFFSFVHFTTSIGNHLEYSNEPVLLSGKHELNKRKLEKELTITRFDIAQFTLYHKRESLYFPYIEEQIKERDLPDDLKYITVAESALRNDIVSHAGAAGIWQFVPDTARQYGLRVDSEIDERLNFEKATNAALTYLEKLYNQFDDWTLATAAYNRWENGLRRDMKSQPNANSYYELYLNKETGRYLYRIIAIKYLMQDRYNFFSKKQLGNQYVAPRTTTEEIIGPITDLQIWSVQNNHLYSEIRELNPWIKGNSLPEGKWKLTVFK